jgi:small subunit ribosomal protein S18
MATKKRGFFTQKICRFCSEKIDFIEFHDVKLLKPLISERGKIVPSRISGNCARHQRQLTEAVKRARNIALLPFSVEY